jgi:S-adenosylmethionine/arginine decarboxylase-like enzyme
MEMNLHRAGTKVGGTFRADPKLLKSKDIINKFLTTLVLRLEMNDIHTVTLDVADEIKKKGQPLEADEGGLTAFCVLSTSHIAIHTWPEECGATYDVHSCRDFPPSLVKAIIEDVFQSNDVEIFDLSYSLV